MLRKVKSFLFQGISFIFVAYGFYLLYLFLLDTTLRVVPSFAYPVSVGITLLLSSLTLLYWVKKKRLPF